LRRNADRKSLLRPTLPGPLAGVPDISLFLLSINCYQKEELIHQLKYLLSRMVNNCEVVPTLLVVCFAFCVLGFAFCVFVCDGDGDCALQPLVAGEIEAKEFYPVDAMHGYGSPETTTKKSCCDSI